MTTTTIAQTTNSLALEQASQNQSWLLPDNSLIVAFDTGTTNFAGTNTNHLILVQSTNWQTGTPTWTFVKQISSVANLRASLWWASAQNRLHIAYAGVNATSTTGLFYLSATYSAGVWTWDSAPVTLVAASDPTNNVSVPGIVVNTAGTVWVCYRNQTVATPTTSVQMVSRVGGVSAAWGSAVQVSQTTSTTNSAYYGAFDYDGTTVILITSEGGSASSYFAQAHTDGGAWGAIAAGPTNLASPGQQYGPLSVFCDGGGGAWVSMSSINGLYLIYLTWTGNAVTWNQLSTATKVDASNSASAAQMCNCGGTIYAFFYKQSGTGIADVYATYYVGSTGSWSGEINLTNASASNNLNPVVAHNFAFSAGTVTAMPLIYENGTTSPFTVSLSPIAPFASTHTFSIPMRFNLQTKSPFNVVPLRFRLATQPTTVPLRFNLAPDSRIAGLLPDNPYGITSGLFGSDPGFDSRIALIAAALGIGWFRIQYDMSLIWQNQNGWPTTPIDPTTWNWAPLDRAVSLLNLLGFHVVFPLRGTPNWGLTVNATYYLNTDGSKSVEWQMPDAATVAAFAKPCAARYDGIGTKWQTLYGTPGPIGANGKPLRIHSFEIGNEEYNQHFSKPAASQPTNPRPIYGYNQEAEFIYNAFPPAGPCTSGIQPARAPRYLIAILKAAQPAIKAQYPGAIVGMNAMWWNYDNTGVANGDNYAAFLQGMYNGGCKNFFDYANLHYYSNNNPPEGAGNTPSLATVCKDVLAVMKANGDGAKPLWITEFGWGSTDQGNGFDCDETERARRYQSFLDQARTSKVAAKVFMFTYTWGFSTGSLVQQWGLTPAHYTLQNYIQQYPNWTGTTGGGGGTNIKTIPLRFNLAGSTPPPPTPAEFVDITMVGRDGIFTMTGRGE